MDIDATSAFESYLKRFEHDYGPKAPGAFVKFGNHMVQRLSPEDFQSRLDDYVNWHRQCKTLLGSGATISDALVLEFEEAAAWLIIKAPDLLAMFRGELGDPEANLAQQPGMDDPDRPRGNNKKTI